MANGEEATITRLTVPWDVNTTLAELAGRYLTTEEQLVRLNAAAGIDLSTATPGESVIVVPNEVPLELPFADWFWTVQARQATTGQPIITPREWLDTEARNAALQTYVPQVAEFIGPNGSDTRPDFERPRLGDVGFESTPTQLVAQGRDVTVTPGQISIGEAGTGLGSLSFAQAPMPGDTTGGAAPGAGGAALQDTNGDGVFSSADLIDGTFGPQGEVPPPPGWVWGFDPSLGDFTLRKLDPVGDTSRLDEWVFVPGANFETDKTDGTWQRIQNPEITDPLKNVPIGVRPWLSAVLSGKIDAAQISDPVARDWVRFTLRGITDASLRRGQPPESLPFGTPAPQIEVAPTRTFDQLNDTEKTMLAPFGIQATSTPEEIDKAIKFIEATPPDDLALFRQQERADEGGRAAQQVSAPPPTEALTPSDVSPSQNEAGISEPTQAQIDNNRLPDVATSDILGLEAGDGTGEPIQPFLLPPAEEQ